ncbi:MAG: phosphonate ABC transporter substrate-binding protein [Inquilinaceae bacterium]
MSIRHLVPATLIALAAGATAIPAQAAEINFGIISTESTQNLRAQWEPFLDAMEEQTGHTINPFFASDYAGIIEAMRFDKVQVAWYGNKSAMEAVDRADGEIFAQTVDVAGNPGYWSVLIAPSDSPISSVEDVLACDQSIDFGIGDPNSTSGFLVPTTFIFAAEGVDPQSCFKTVRNANHETNAMAVANKQVDVATNNTENMARIQENNPEAFAKIKEIWRSPLIPSDPLVWRADLDTEIKQDLLYFVMSYGRAGTKEDVGQARAVLAGLGWAPFVPSSNAQLYPIRQMELNKEMMEVTSDERLSDDEKNARLAEIEAAMEEIVALSEQFPRM